jgi:Tol biopolymer transport system component
MPHRALGYSSWIVLPLLAAATVASDVGRAAPAAFPGGVGRIAYNVAASGKGAWISTISPNGTRIRTIVSGREDAFSPSWSPNGRRIVFVRAGEIWYVNGDGQRPLRVTSRSKVVDPESPAWSPDGKRIVFAARTSPRNYDIFVCNVNGRGLRRLTANAGLDEHPRWSRFAPQIVFTRARSPLGAPELWVMTAEGRTQHRIALGSSPDWSPNGRNVVFVRGQEIWVANRDGRHARRVVAGPGAAGDPAWSPDGRWIVFWSDRASGEATKGDLYVASSDGELVSRLTSEPELWHFAPSWQPGGRHPPLSPGGGST